MLIKAMVLLLIAAFAGLFFIKDPDGNALLKIDDLAPDVSLPEKAAKPAIVYKWQDENGVWQFSNKPEEAKAGAEMMELDGNINTIPAPATTRTGGTSKTTGTTRSAIKLPPGLTTVSSDQVNEMMDQVNGLQETLNTRKGEIDQVTGQN